MAGISMLMAGIEVLDSAAASARSHHDDALWQGHYGVGSSVIICFEYGTISDAQTGARG